MNYNVPENVPPVWGVGDVLLDRYEVKQIFTGGGMGLVYRVHHREWGVDLAAKSPRTEFFQTKHQIEDFEREAETWVNLGLHPHIVSCYYVRRLGGIPRVFAEFVDGGTLSDWIRTKRLYEGSWEMALKQIVDIAIQFAWGLHYAHERGLVHQDVKPGNVLLSSDGTAKVSDFGLASARRTSSESGVVPAHAAQSILVPGSGFMTPAYASPEQLRGEPLSRKTDIWSWGVSLMEMLLGELTWSSGLAAPAVLAELEPGRFDRKLITMLEGCFGSGSRERLGSFDMVLDELTSYYESRFGTYRRTKAEAVQLSSDESNNHAISLADLGKHEEALLTLEVALANDPTHVLATYNYALINQRLSYKSDAFGRDALQGLFQQDPSNRSALSTYALLCVERGLAFRAQELHRQLRAVSGKAAPYVDEIATLIKTLPSSEIQQPVVMKVSNEAIKNLRLSPDGDHFVVTRLDGTQTSYCATGESCTSIGSEYQFLCWSSCGPLFWKDDTVLQPRTDGVKLGVVYAWHFRDEPQLLKSFRMKIPDHDYFAVSADGKRCFVACADLLTMFDTFTGKALWTELDEITDHNNESTLRGIAFSSDGKQVAFAHSNALEGLQVRDVEDGKSVDMECAVDSCRTLISLSPKWMVSTSWKSLLQVWDLNERKAVAAIQLESNAPHAIPIASGEIVGILNADNCIQFMTIPGLSRTANVSFMELGTDNTCKAGKATCLASSDGRAWLVGTSSGEVIRFRLSEPHRAPTLIAKPASHQELRTRWQEQEALLEDAHKSLAAGDNVKAIKKCRLAMAIRNGRADCAELHDKIIGLGRKDKVVSTGLVFDIERTILGGDFEIVDVTPDCRRALVKRTYFSEGKDYAGDYFRLLHLPDGRVERLPEVPDGRWRHSGLFKFDLLRRLGPNRDCVIATTATGMSVIPLGLQAATEIQQLNAPPVCEPRAFDGFGHEQKPDYYASDLQFALGGEVIVAADLASAWCSDHNRCQEWHSFVRRTGAVTRINANTSHLRIMPDGFHAYAVAPIGIHWLWWPFQKAFETFDYPKDLNYGSHNHRNIWPERVAFSSDQSRIFLGDGSGGLYVWDLKLKRYDGWQRIDAHAGMIMRVFTGWDARFVVTVGVDGMKLWRAMDMTLLYHRKNLKPEWLSEDLRFAVEKRGAVWEIEWDYIFDPPDEIESIASPHVEGFLRARQALAKLNGDSIPWDQDACDTLTQELAKRGCGVISPEIVNSLISRFPYLLRGP